MNDHSKPFHMQSIDYAAPSSLEPTHLFTDEQIKFYHAHGYVSVDAVMPAAEILSIREIYDCLFDPARSNASGDIEKIPVSPNREYSVTTIAPIAGTKKALILKNHQVNARVLQGGTQRKKQPSTTSKNSPNVTVTG